MKVAILGTGNVGTDLLMKVAKCGELELVLFSGIDPASEGIARARAQGWPTSTEGVEAILAHGGIDLVFDATSARAHFAHAPRLREAGIVAIDLTPAKVGKPVVPTVNLDEVADELNVNLVSCGGQATIPIVHAIASVCKLRYAEVVCTIASKSAGPGTRQNIDEFTRTTAHGLVTLGGAARGKAIIILNPADPPLIMTNTVHAEVEEPDIERVESAVRRVVERVQRYVPGYRLRVPPVVDGDRITTILEVEGAGDYLPAYAGNLDIITSAAVEVARQIARRRRSEVSV